MRLLDHENISNMTWYAANEEEIGVSGMQETHLFQSSHPRLLSLEAQSWRGPCLDIYIYIYFFLFPQISQIQKYFVGYISVKYVSGRPGKLAVRWINLCHVLLSCGCESESSFASRRESSKLSIQLFSATVCLLD